MEPIKVRVFGEDYPLLVENRELTESAAKQVDLQMYEYRRKGIDLSTTKIAILTAITFAEKVIELEQRLDQLTGKITNLTRLLSTRSSNTSE
ncbi:MAG: cell division protein ZapA [Candidatus Thermochlorobacter aerophilum]|jgi:cell division protein ZapA|uniref:Cell division protein ZapA n=1 Tax=Candidatus Thermochlorobacter aerophilus TaxID=1868324 RepID=A0A395M2F2_9BACT|nr:MAG: cell division protein ZapA [Candidatus Thermochlorobacter aerophilum]